MTTLHTWAHALYLWLSAINPLLPWALLVFVPCFAVPWALRSFAPHFWELIPRAVDKFVMFVHLPLDGFGAQALAKIAQGLPSALMGAVAAALALGTDPGQAFKGALAGAGAPLLHELLKALPWVPYTGGRFPAAGVTPKPPMGGSGTAVLLLVGLGALALPQTACVHPTTAQSAQVSSVLALAYNGAATALVVLDEHEATYLDGLSHPTAEQLQAAKLRVERLERAKAMLDGVREIIAGKAGDPKADLVEAAHVLSQLAAEMAADGVKLPQQIAQGLALASAFGGAS